MFNSNSVHRKSPLLLLYQFHKLTVAWARRAVPAASYTPPVCCLLREAPRGLTCTLFPFILIMEKELSGRSRKKGENKIKRDFSPLVSFWDDICVGTPTLTHRESGGLAPSCSLLAFTPHVCLVVISERSAV